MSAQPDFISPDFKFEDLEVAHPREILQWTAGSIDRLAIATSFQSSGLVILHLMTQIRPDVPVLFLDTGFHFDETHEFKQRITDMWNLKIVELRGEHGSVSGQAAIHGPELYRRDPDLCCRINKVLPLQKALEEYDGWVSGLRRDQSPLRAETPIVEAQMLPSGNEIMKIHPLAHWSKQDVADYVAANDIPTHPLFEKGFASIGCWPCTRAINDNEQERDGRWTGQSKTECGIHTFGHDHGPKETEADQ